MTRILPGVIAMATIVVASNILVQFLLLDGLLTWGAFTYPLAFLVTDVMNRVYGPAAARKVVFAGLVVGIICSLIGSQIMLQGDGFEYPAVALRIAISPIPRMPHLRSCSSPRRSPVLQTARKRRKA